MRTPGEIDNHAEFITNLLAFLANRGVEIQSKERIPLEDLEGEPWDPVEVPGFRMDFFLDLMEIGAPPKFEVLNTYFLTSSQREVFMHGYDRLAADSGKTYMDYVPKVDPWTMPFSDEIGERAFAHYVQMRHRALEEHSAPGAVNS